jgi:hypothetical protein
MKTLLLAFFFLFTLSYSVKAQTVSAHYLDPMFSGAEYKYTIFGNSTTGSQYGGFMLNNTNTSYGNGNDVVFYTYEGRDMTLRTGGNIFLNTTHVGINTYIPQAKLHIPNGDIIVGGIEGIVNNINASLIIKSRADNNVTYPFYVGKYGSGSDLFWVRGEGNAYLRGSFGIGTNNPEGQFQVVNDNPLVVIGGDDQHTNGQSTLRFYAGEIIGSNHYTNGFDISFRKNATTDRLDFIDGRNVEVLTLKKGGNVGIGTVNPDATLTVKGNIHTQEVLVDLEGAVTPDYVFEETYDLSSLEEVEIYIKENKHLPEVPSAKEMEAEGMNLKQMNLLLLKKVEELTLHLIEQGKKTEKLEKENSELKKLNIETDTRLKVLESLIKK